MSSAELLGVIFLLLWVVTILRYWPGSTSAEFFLTRAKKYLLWLPYGLCCAVTLITFPTRSGPLIAIPDLVLVGIFAGVLTLIGHTILEIVHLRDRSRWHAGGSSP